MVREERSDVSPGRELIAAMVSELETHYGPLAIGSTPSATPDDMTPPGGAFLVLYDGARAIANRYAAWWFEKSLR